MGLEATYYLDSRSVNMRGHAGGHISLWWIRDVFDRQLGGEDSISRNDVMYPHCFEETAGGDHSSPSFLHSC